MPTDEVTYRNAPMNVVGSAKLGPVVCGQGDHALPDASEQRGYDRAIAEVVAMLDKMADAEWAAGDHESECGASALEDAKRAIEAGEHKP